MAEIRVEPRRRPVWPWILIVLILIAAAAWWFYMRHTGQPLPTTGTLLNGARVALSAARPQVALSILS